MDHPVWGLAGQYGNCGTSVSDLTRVLLNSPLLDRVFCSLPRQKNHPPNPSHVSLGDLTKAVMSYARTSVTCGQLLLMAALDAGGMKLQPQKSHPLSQQHTAPRPGCRWLLVMAITGRGPCFAQGEFSVCCIIMFGCATSPPCRRQCSGTGWQGRLSGQKGTAEESEKRQPEPMESCREQRQKAEDKACRLAQPPVLSYRDSFACSKLRLRAGHAQKHLREQIGQLWGKTHFTADASL